MENPTSRIISFFSNFLRRQITPDENIFSSAAVNSLFLLQMIMFLEREFGIRIENADLEMDNFRTITTIAALIERKTVKAAGASNLHD